MQAFLFLLFMCSRQMVNHGPRRWSEVSPKRYEYLVPSSTAHSSSENPETKACVFATGCFSVTETFLGTSGASGVRSSLYYKLLTK